MFLEVEKIPPKGLTLNLDMVINQARLTEGRTDGPFEARLKFKRRGERVKAWGTIKGTVILSCSRCAEEFSFEVESSFSLDILPIYYLREGEVSLQEGELDTTFYRNGKIEVERLVTDQINLSIPMKPLCRVDCKGICPVCGANRNKINCGHVEKIPDPRLSQLKILLEVKNGSA